MTATAVRPVSIAVMPPVPVASMRRMVQEPAGDWTLLDVVNATNLDPNGLTVSLDGQVVPPEKWETTVPTEGQSVIVSPRPGIFALFLALYAGAGATLATASTLAIVAAAVSTAIVVGGISMLASALLAPSQSTPDAVAPGVRRTIGGGNNQFRQYATTLQVLGEHRVFPDLAARGYTTVEDGKLYRYDLYTFGYGQLALSQFKIGDEPLFVSSQPTVYTGIMEANAVAFGGRVTSSGVENGKIVKMEVRAGTGSDASITLFSKNVQQQEVGKDLKKSRGWQRARTPTDVTRITVIVSCPNGLIWRTRSGDVLKSAVRIGVRYRLASSSGAWTSVEDIKMKDATQSSVFASRDIEVAEGTYDVEVMRETADNADPAVIDDTSWQTMLTTRSGGVVTETGLCLVAMKTCLSNTNVRASDQFNAIAQTVCPDYNAGTGTWITRATSNPASLFRHVLQGRANKRAVADARINLTALAAWHVENDSKGFEFNYVTSGRATVLDVLRYVAAAGRASPAVQDGLFSVVREHALTGAPVQHFTPRNIRSMVEVRRLVTPPQAFKVQFVDPDSGYLDTERIVPADGYTVATATTFERLDMPGITSADQAYKLGRYHLAVLLLRPSDFIIETDFEHLDCVRGDWVRLNHDVILVGLAAGRVVSVTLNGGGDATGVVLDQQCPMAAATYGIRFRKSDGSSVHKVVTTAAGNQTTLTFATPITLGNPMPVADDLFLFGESGSESIDCIVKEIEPLEELGARLTLVNANASILTADSGTIPKYTPQITIPPKINPAPPAKPLVLSVTSADVRETKGGPVRERGLRVRLQTPRSRAV